MAQVQESIFISHSHIDDPFVNKLAGHLAKHKIAPFVDHQHIQPGEHWPSRVQKALKTCSKMVVILSDHSVNSRNCMDEWDYFLDWKGKPPKEIIPVRLGGSETYFRLGSFHFIDFSTPAAEEAALKQLISRLTDNWADQPAAVPPQHSEPDRPLSARLHVRYPLARRSDKFVGIATGNIAEIVGVDVLVNSENNWFAMDAATPNPEKAQRSVSAAIHSFGAQWSERGELLADSIDDELKAAIVAAGLTPPVPLTTVLDTSAGSLTDLGIQRIVHVVSVGNKQGRRNSRVGTPIQLGRCVANALAHVDKLNRAGHTLRRVVMPVFGTGRLKLKLEQAAPTLIARLVDYLEFEDTQIEAVYLTAFRQPALDTLTAMFDALPDLDEPVSELA